ncbi:hypothetical protein K488DRAFT_87892 [Vararia minispora EC-137]|uniref:Uncharacterized protein n=1 Tax=Vararia minispora EC-137 TaxID=1314806 RepID=A0ACB8QG89_9AGAM|nr:hypothetical protein K488DRAFT_87892 [Vararia minispora EC-137]
MTLQFSHPEALEKIFQKLEQESERRAQEDLASNPVAAGAAAARSATRDRRRTSISISRFGQVDDPQTTTFSIPTTPTLSTTPHIYTQRHRDSTDSLESTSSTVGAHEHHLESDHVTQVHRIAARQSIGRSVGGILQRTLSRSRSKPQLVAGADVDVVIGVVVEEAATVEHAPEEDDLRPESRAMAYADSGRQLRNQASRFTIAAAAPPPERKGIMGRAKELSRRIRGRAQTVVDADRA